MSATEEAGEILEPASPELLRACTDFLYREAQLLDENQNSTWFETCVSKELDYRIPVRTTRERAAGVSEFASDSFHWKEGFYGMQMRVKRLATEHAWAEDPPSRTRRLVTNIRVRERADGEAEVRSYLQLYRSQWDTTDFDLIVGERQDVLRIENGEWRLLRRLVLLDHTTLGTANLGVFL